MLPDFWINAPSAEAALSGLGALRRGGAFNAFAGTAEGTTLPLDFMGTASCLVDQAYFALRDHLGLKGDGRLFRREDNTRFYDERILDAFGVDFRRVWMRQPQERTGQLQADGTLIDEWGLKRRKIGELLSYVGAPLESASVSDLNAYPWPDAYDPERVVGLADEARRLHEAGTHAIVARSPGLGIFDMAQRLRGMERFLMDLLIEKRFASALLHRIKEVQMGFYDAFLSAVGPYVDIVETGDDYGAQRGPLISPKVFRELIAPARAELNRFIKQKAPHARVFLHSDGAIFKLIPSFIEIGVDILNPVEPDVPGNDPAALKSTFGDQLVFHGHLDNKQALRRSVHEARAEVRRAFDGMGSGGGYIMAPTNHIQVDVPPQNLAEVYRYADEYGRYAPS